jgi:hypothetical protein
MRRLWPALALALAAPACGGRQPPPKRAVIEGDVESWSFGRYQALLDVEVWVPENSASAHTASYVHRDALKRGRVDEPDVVNVFVTRYESGAGVLPALIRFVRRLSLESGYAVEEREIEGVRLFFVSGAGEVWAMWAADRHVVKIGGRGRDGVPGAIVEVYGEPYPSRIEEGALEGPIPSGPEPTPESEEPFDPDDPRPDWDHDGAGK